MAFIFTLDVHSKSMHCHGIKLIYSIICHFNIVNYFDILIIDIKQNQL